MTWIDLFPKCSAQSTYWDANHAIAIQIMYATWFDL